MNTRSTVITLSIIGGLIGLGVLANYLIQEAPAFDPGDRVKDPAQNKKPSTSGNKPIANTDTNADSFAFQQEKEKDEPEQQTALSQGIQTSPNADDFPLRLGSNGPRVERLQVFLLRNYGYSGRISGMFDEQTESELKRRLNRTALDEATFRKYRMGKHVNEQVIIR